MVGWRDGCKYLEARSRSPQMLDRRSSTSSGTHHVHFQYDLFTVFLPRYVTLRHLKVQYVEHGLSREDAKHRARR